MLNIIIKNKNPNNIVEYCFKYNVYTDLVNDPNSHFWLKLIETHYHNHLSLKNTQLSFKDFYVLLYYCELFTLINDYNLINKSQDLLLKLPKIYQGDHVAIIHASNNIALRMKKADAIMTRNKNQKDVYGLGYLVIRYVNNNGNDEFVEKYIEKYRYVNGVDPLQGGNICI